MALIKHFFLCSILICVLFTIAHSRPQNETNDLHVQNFSKRGFTWLGSLQTTVGRQLSVFGTWFLVALKEVFLKYGKMKIKIWNNAEQIQLEDPTWKGINLQVETPISKVLQRGNEPVEIVAHYTKYIYTHWPKRLWVSYGIADTTYRICIFVKYKSIFRYTVYLTGTDACDEPNPLPPENVFVSQNDKESENRYTSNWNNVIAYCAVDSYDYSYTLNVYIQGIDVPQDHQKRQLWRAQPENPNQVVPVNENVQEEGDNPPSVELVDLENQNRPQSTHSLPGNGNQGRGHGNQGLGNQQALYVKASGILVISGIFANIFQLNLQLKS